MDEVGRVVLKVSWLGKLALVFWGWSWISSLWVAVKYLVSFEVPVGLV